MSCLVSGKYHASMLVTPNDPIYPLLLYKVKTVHNKMLKNNKGELAQW